MSGSRGRRLLTQRNTKKYVRWNIHDDHHQSCQRMMPGSLCLLFMHVGLCVHSYILDPENSPHQGSSRDVSLAMPGMTPLQSQDWSLDEELGFTRGLSEKRTERHVDAIFTNTYRKILGQISARRYLQNKMGKRLGQDLDLDPEDEDLGHRTLRDTLASMLIGRKNPTQRKMGLS